MGKYNLYILYKLYLHEKFFVLIFYICNRLHFIKDIKMNIKEIAGIAGVSSATVSRVINNSGYVKEETKKKVLGIIEKYDYVPNAIARSLSINDSLSIGVIIPDIENEFFSKVISGISELADEYRYNLVLLCSNENLQKEHEFLRLVESQRLRGIIITPISESDKFTQEYLFRLKRQGIPIVLVDRDVKEEVIDGVFVDNKLGAYEGVLALIKAGHGDIAIITGPDTSKPGKDRYKGFEMAMKEAGLYIKKEYIECGDFKIEKAYECMKRLMNLKTPPTAVFSSNNLTTLGCLKYITEKGLKPGEDISIIGFDEIEALKIIDYNLSVIDRDAKEQGKEAMKLLYKAIKRESAHKKSIERIIIPHNIILRGSEKKN